MHIVNAMFAKGLGGIEQSFLDYCSALETQGNRVTAFVHPKGEIRGRTAAVIVAISNLGQWDPVAKFRIRRQLKKLKPDAVIVHGNRAVSLMRPAARGICPVIGVTHNYSVRRLAELDAVFALTADLERKMVEVGFPGNRIFRIPNMVATGAPASAGLRQPVFTIATLGRFVKKKGFDVWIKAMAELQKKNMDYRAVIGGVGEEETPLKQLAAQHNLNDRVIFTGWVTQKEPFFRSADVFVLPSHHEPFGIVLLEAMASGLPVITTDSEGPSEIVRHEYDALIVPRDNPAAMAEAIARLMDDPTLAEKLRLNALETVRTHYDIQAVSARIQQALEEVIRA